MTITADTFQYDTSFEVPLYNTKIKYIVEQSDTLNRSAASLQSDE